MESIDIVTAKSNSRDNWYAFQILTEDISIKAGLAYDSVSELAARLRKLKNSYKERPLKFQKFYEVKRDSSILLTFVPNPGPLNPTELKQLEELVSSE